MASKRTQILEWLASRSSAEVDEPLYAELRAAIPEVSEGTVKKALRESGLKLAPLVEGVRQDTLEHLERTLRALLDEYEQGDRARQKQVRAVVITAKQHARWSKHEEPQLWLQTWLENPPLFPSWVEIRKKLLEH